MKLQKINIIKWIREIERLRKQVGNRWMKLEPERAKSWRQRNAIQCNREVLATRAKATGNEEISKYSAVRISDKKDDKTDRTLEECVRCE